MKNILLFLILLGLAFSITAEEILPSNANITSRDFDFQFCNTTDTVIFNLINNPTVTGTIDICKEDEAGKLNLMKLMLISATKTKNIQSITKKFRNVKYTIYKEHNPERVTYVCFLNNVFMSLQCKPNEEELCKVSLQTMINNYLYNTKENGETNSDSSNNPLCLSSLFIISIIGLGVLLKR